MKSYRGCRTLARSEIEHTVVTRGKNDMNLGKSIRASNPRGTWGLTLKTVILSLSRQLMTLCLGAGFVATCDIFQPVLNSGIVLSSCHGSRLFVLW